MKQFHLITLLLLALVSLTACSSSQPVTKDCLVLGYEYNGQECVRVFDCGDDICEIDKGESKEVCPADCSCQTQYCNEDVKVVCDSADCAGQEALFDDFVAIQTQVVHCLENYFDHDATRVTYHIEQKELAVCQNEQGCFREGGQASRSDIYQHNLMGITQKGQSYVTESKNLHPDEHETTHVFLHQMLGNIRLWFHEAIAIQTNERVNCDQKVQGVGVDIREHMESGDAYLRETSSDKNSKYGVSTSSGHYVNDDLYLSVKKGDVQLTQNDLENTHLVGALWIMGLANEYGCYEDCVADIVKELRNYHQSTGLQVTNDIIEEKTSLVVGSDTTWLFDLLELELESSAKKERKIVLQ